MITNKFYLLDLERTIIFGVPVYWAPSKRGYTEDINGAGIYSLSEANDITSDDINNETISINYETIQRILKK